MLPPRQHPADAVHTADTDQCRGRAGPTEGLPVHQQRRLREDLDLRTPRAGRVEAAGGQCRHQVERGWFKKKYMSIV